jgi:SAM-dependent methyltransferase
LLAGSQDGAEIFTSGRSWSQAKFAKLQLLGRMKDLLGKALLKWRIKVVLPHIKGYLLDIGCGTNQLVRSYHGKGIGVDVHQWGEVDLVVDDTAKLPFDDGTFDTATIIASLNHIPNRGEVLSEANRILKEKGRIIITMIPPGLSRIWHILRRPWDADQRERGMKEGEKFGLTCEEVRGHLIAAGFKMGQSEKFMLGINTLTVGHKKF